MPSSSLTASTHHVGRAIPEAHTHREPAPPEPSSHWRADPLNRQWTQDSLSLALAQLSVLGPDEGGELAEGELRSDGSASSLERARSLERRTPAPELWLGRCATDEMLVAVVSGREDARAHEERGGRHSAELGQPPQPTPFGQE